jgi:hypothetical protein
MCIPGFRVPAQGLEAWQKTLTNEGKKILLPPIHRLYSLRSEISVGVLVQTLISDRREYYLSLIFFFTIGFQLVMVKPLLLKQSTSQNTPKKKNTSTKKQQAIFRLYLHHIIPESRNHAINEIRLYLGYTSVQTRDINYGYFGTLKKPSDFVPHEKTSSSIVMSSFGESRNFNFAIC